MKGWKLTREAPRIAVLCIAGVIAACAHAPASREMSILDALDNQQSLQGPASCAALNATAVCEKTTRLEGKGNCKCVDTRAITGAGAFRL